MQTLFEIGFVLAVVVPTATLIVSAAAVLGSSFVYWRSHGDRRIEERGAVAVHHPVGR